MQAEGVYEVLEGLREGEAIVTSAQFLIDSESNLNAALKTMTSESNGDGEEATPSEHKH